MPTSFEEAVAQLGPLLEELKNSLAYSYENKRNLPKKGVYVFYEDGKPMYVGRVGVTTKQTISGRIGQHARSSSPHNQATFAFRLLQEDLDLLVGHESDLTRPQIAEKYEAEFRERKARVRNMQVRAVEVTDSVVQTVFEVYAALALGTTRYNLFDTH